MLLYYFIVFDLVFYEFIDYFVIFNEWFFNDNYNIEQVWKMVNVMNILYNVGVNKCINVINVLYNYM